jgi:hypothetical protein
MQRLGSLNHQNIHRFRGYRLNLRKRRYRMYHQYCEYADLYDVLRFYSYSHNARYKQWVQQGGEGSDSDCKLESSN